MSDIFEKTFGTADTKNLTPIEIALGVDGEGRTTATKLYEFLELNPSNYSKWFKKNITENQFAEENVDYFPFVLRYESLTGEKERDDAKLTSSFAKKLSMMQKNQKGEEARKYFVRIEDGAKKMVNMIPERNAPLTDNPGKVANLINVLAKRMDNQGSEPYKSAEMAQLICSQYGIQLPADFVKVPEYKQIDLQDFMEDKE